jgi:multidrug efflux pump subunit AcrA (membrane-fusion protein)
MSKSIFRQVALERLSSPEQLDLLMPVISLRGWIALLALLSLMAVILIWSVFDTIPTQITGRGILIRGGQVLQVTAPQGGQIEDVFVQAGMGVEAGQRIATIRPAHQSDLIEVTSLLSGRVIELAMARGSVIEAGQTILTLEDTYKPLEAVMYVPVSSGKSLQSGMTVQISPDSVQGESYGYMRGTIRSVAAAWSSASGPPVTINSGTLLTAAVTVDERHPIELLLPGR